jgi:5-methylcytosine-specific restriction enzyme A
MPTRPLRPCSQPGCPALVQSGRCLVHKREQRRPHDERRGTAHERGYGARWQRVRKTFLAAHPLCRSCEHAGRLTPAKVVDHIVPHRGNMELFWDRANWAPMCAPCHDRKTGGGA